MKMKISLLLAITLSFASILSFGRHEEQNVKAATDQGALYSGHYYSSFGFENLTLKGSKGTMYDPVDKEKYIITNIKYSKTGFTGKVDHNFKTLTVNKYKNGYEFKFNIGEPGYYEKISTTKYKSLIGSYTNPIGVTRGNWISLDGKQNYSFSFNKDKTGIVKINGDSYKIGDYIVNKNTIVVGYGMNGKVYSLFITVLGKEIWVSDDDFVSEEMGYEHAVKLVKK